jgi:hypothetical protein
MDPQLRYVGLLHVHMNILLFKSPHRNLWQATLHLRNLLPLSKLEIVSHKYAEFHTTFTQCFLYITLKTQHEEKTYFSVLTNEFDLTIPRHDFR